MSERILPIKLHVTEDLTTEASYHLNLEYMVLLRNKDLSEYVILYGSFIESFDYHKQSLRNYKNII